MRTLLAALLLPLLAVSLRAADAPAAAPAPDLTESPEYQALVAKEDAELAALEKKHEAELLEKAKDPKFDKKAAEKMIRKHADAEAKAAAKEVKEEEAYLMEHAPKPVEPAKEKK
jgi:hypothetical protein